MGRYLKIIAVLLALLGLADATYLTVHHFTAEPVPCSLIEGCEQVLTSEYAELFGFPLAAFGAAAYFVAFSLALLAVYGNRAAWKLFGIQAAVMAAVSGWLIYVQGALIGAFCQFCLLSALTSFSLFIVFLLSLTARARSEPQLD
jgi:uncharacterized membrane protein